MKRKRDGLPEMRCEKIIEAPANMDISFDIENGKMAIGYAIGAIEVWDCATWERVKCLAGHGSWVSALIFWNGDLVSSSYDLTIKVWNCETGECVKSLVKPGTSQMHTLVVWEGSLVSGDNDGNIYVWDYETGGIAWILDNGRYRLASRYAPRCRVTSLVIWNGKLTSGYSDGNIRVWDYETRECKKRFVGEGRCVSLAVWRGKLVSSHFMGAIHVWKYETGECEKTLDYCSDGFTTLVVWNNKLVTEKSRSFLSFDWETYKREIIAENEAGNLNSDLSVWNDKLVCFDTRDIRFYGTRDHERLQVALCWKRAESLVCSLPRDVMMHLVKNFVN